MARSARTAECGRADAAVRLRTAEAYADTVQLVLGDTTRSEFANVAAGLAVLTGLGASDAICCVRLGRRHRGDDHRGATEFLRQATPDGAKMAATLTRLLDVKDRAHYGARLIDLRTATNAVRWAMVLVSRAREELEG